MLTRLSLDAQWSFHRLAAGETAPAPDATWTAVALPHTPFVADLDGREHWLGLCAYRCTLQVTDAATLASAGARFAVHIGAAMHTCIALLDDQEIGRHHGGYLPFELDVTSVLADGAPHPLTLILDNRDAPDVPPGKPYAELDFCWYGGLYRETELRVYPPLHFTDPVAAGEPAGGGVFMRTLAASAERARVALQCHVRNTSPHPVADAHVAVTFRYAGQIVGQAHSDSVSLCAGEARHVVAEITLEQPHLWSPASPSLHDVEVILVDANGAVADRHRGSFGIRWVTFSRSRGLELNGHPLRPRGTNRHQEWPRVGYAAPPAAQRRDARLIKEAGFDYVRQSHYPQSPAFLDACDELGLLVMAAIPGWQFIGGEAFRAACYQNARDLIRRDRNHACVVLWELSLNETAMDDAFMDRLHAIGHEEFPGPQMFTAGWIDRFDVYLHSRQHGQIHRWANADKALVIAEYGDWEFFASNHGFDQTTGAGLFAAWSHARQLRSAGERGLRQQAWNHVIALNDTLSSPAALDGQWSAFDYARGYDPQRAACGMMDIFRLPKFSYWFYRSQRDPSSDGGDAWTGGPVVFIASHWTPASDLRVLVFTNATEVELHLNGTRIGRNRPAFAWMTQYLPHPPCVFDLPAFTPGTLDAHAYISDRLVASHRVSTPRSPLHLTAAIDWAGIHAAATEPDVVCAHARLCDDQGALCVSAPATVSFHVDGHAEIVGPSTVDAEAGIASIVLRLPAGAKSFTLHATTPAVANPTSIAWHDAAVPENCPPQHDHGLAFASPAQTQA